MRILQRCDIYTDTYRLLLLFSISLSADVDYDNIPPSEAVELVFDPSNSERSVTISIIDDTLLERVEFFFGELTTTFSTVILDPRQANISIIDDDGKS